MLLRRYFDASYAAAAVSLRRDDTGLRYAIAPLLLRFAYVIAGLLSLAAGGTPLPLPAMLPVDD